MENMDFKVSKKKILVACEESQRVCEAFRKLGYEAYSCGTIPLKTIANRIKKLKDLSEEEWKELYGIKLDKKV